MNARKTFGDQLRVIPVILMVFFIGQGIWAQSDSINRPSLGDHYFTPVSYSNLPFTDSYLSTLTGYGQTTDLVHQLGSIGNIDLRGLKGKVAFIDMGFIYQQRVRDWMAAYVSLGFSARLGTELQSILAQGVNTLSNFEIGWHIRLLKRDKYAISTIVQLQNNQASFMNVLGFVRDVINDFPEPSITENIPLLSAASGLRFAWGLSELVGFKASTNLAYGESYTRGENGFSFKAGAGIDLDFNPRYSVPVGLLVNYSISSMPDIVYIEGKKAQMGQVKIAYTGASDFNIGIEYSYQKIPLFEQTTPPTVQSIALAVRYYF